MAQGKKALELTFLGTRGELKINSRWHRRHSSLLVEQNDARIMIDCGTDWLGRLTAIAPTAILLTHAHPDHAGGLAQGAPCPVYATSETLRLVRRFPLRDRPVPIKKAITIGGIDVQGLSRSAFHSRASRRIPRHDQGRYFLLRTGRCQASKCGGSARRSQRLYRRWRHDATFDGARKGQDFDRPCPHYSSTRLVRQGTPASGDLHPLWFANRTWRSACAGCDNA